MAVFGNIGTTELLRPTLERDTLDVFLGVLSDPALGSAILVLPGGAADTVVTQLWRSSSANVKRSKVNY